MIFLINKLRSSKEFKSLKGIPEEYFQNLNQNTPEYLLKLISKIIAVFLYRMNVPRREVEAFTDQIERREFTVLFESFEAYDVQETRRISRAEGREEGEELNLIKQVCKKIQKKNTISEMADMLEAEESVIQKICEAASRFAPEYDAEKILEKLHEGEEKNSEE